MEEKDVKIVEEETKDLNREDEYDIESQFYDALRDFLQIPIDTNNLLDKTINTKLFVKGINDVSEYCGQYVACKNVGMDDETIMGIIITRMNNEYQYKISKDNIKGQKDIQKSINKTSEKVHKFASYDEESI